MVRAARLLVIGSDTDSLSASIYLPFCAILKPSLIHGICSFKDIITWYDSQMPIKKR
jgi:hypothetical protein